jgi:Mn-dependent DtxR family transcriptional regulator
VDQTTGSRRRPFSRLQGQYLAFIALYTRLHQVSPAEADLQRRFKVTPPAVHQMILTLERSGLLERVPGKARSLRVIVAEEELPTLE